MDPYLVTAMIYDTCVLDGKYKDKFISSMPQSTFWRRHSSFSNKKVTGE